MNAAARRQDNDNLKQFHAVVKKAYAQAKKLGDIPAVDVSVYDKLVACPAVVHPQAYGNQRLGGWVRPVHAHRDWRRRVKRMYARQQKGWSPLDWFQDIDWEAIWNWILENIVPILKLLLVIVPFII